MKIIKHEKFMDVAIEITKPIVRFPHKVIIRGVWLNQGFVDTFPIGEKAKIDIKTEDIKNWFYCLEPNKQCIRYSKWQRVSNL